MRSVDAADAMRERWVMKRKISVAVMAVLGAFMLAPDSGMASPLAEDALAQAAGAPKASVQNRTKRARPRVNVRPLYPRQNTHSLYPPPYAIGYPGPNARRECVARYVTERRPSGTVIVPRMRCWWVQR